MTTEVPAWAGEIATDLPYPAYVPDMIAAKREAEHGLLPTGGSRAAADEPGGVRAALAADVPRLQAALQAARDASRLPDKPSPEAVGALHDLVVRERLPSA